MPDQARLHIVAAVLVRQDGRVLAATRPDGRGMAGRWEFPGGKLEAGEARWDGLARELKEELGLAIHAGHPLIRLHHDYPQGPRIDLDVWRVEDWSGHPRALEGQRFDWFLPEALTRLDFLDANAPVVAAARLPDQYLVTPARPRGLLAGLEAAVDRGLRLIQLRGDWLEAEDGAGLARAAIERAHAGGAKVLVNGARVDWATAEAWGADGLHLPALVASGLERRPVPRPALLGVSTHGERELARAEALGADFVTLGHVWTTASHPGREPLGEDRFFALAAGAGLPVYAIGGMGPDDLPALKRHGIQGIAAIRALWPA